VQQQLDDVLIRCLIDERDVERLTWLPLPFNKATCGAGAPDQAGTLGAGRH
jgi:hypothetical protein